MRYRGTNFNRMRGFTIIELIVVITVIGIMSAVVIVGYGSWRQQAIETQLKNDVEGAGNAMEASRNFGSDYPSSIPSTFVASDGVTVTLRTGGGTYCVQAQSTSSSTIYTKRNKMTPVKDSTCGNYFVDITGVASSGAGACGIAYGKAYCWGLGTTGQLGNAASSTSSSPVAVNTSVMTGTVTALSTLTDTTCAIAGGKAYCWGVGTSGQLGNGSSSTSSSPVAVNTSIMTGTVTALSGSGSQICAIADAKAYCWGNGTLGNGSSSSSSPVAVNTSVMTGAVTAISNPSQHTCAIADTKAYCWGTGAPDALGSGLGSTSSVPVAVNTTVMSGKVSAIVTLAQHTCAIAEDKAYCWGTGAYGPTDQGALGNGSTTSRSTPTAVDTSLMKGSVSTLISAPNRGCAIADGQAYCWGDGTNGVLGNGSTAQSFTPALVSSIP